MAINKWWTADSKEIYWLESTDRKDLGTNLHAPQFDDSGQDNWRYSLILESRPGDIVYHYYKPSQAIVARSYVSSEPRSSEIVWAARGTYARKKGTQPHARPGWLVDLQQFDMLPNPLTLEQIRHRSHDLTEARSSTLNRYGNPIYFPFEISLKRPIRMLQGYAFKLPVEVVKQFQELQYGIDVPTGLGIDVARRDIGAPYVAPNEHIKTKQRDPFEVDPDAIDRGLRGHAATQNALAEFLTDKHIAPLSPNPSEPPFDIAWASNGETWIAEVKSTTPQNEEKQLRLGLGQILRYRQQMERISSVVNPVLVVENRPIDTKWIDLCRAVGVLLVWPESFQNLLSTGAFD
jgi:hypothetical protein